MSMYLSEKMANVLHEMYWSFRYSTALRLGSGGFVQAKLKKKLSINWSPDKCSIMIIQIRDYFKIENTSNTG